MFQSETFYMSTYREIITIYQVIIEWRKVGVK
jgi:hypothetical protein